MSIIDMRQFCIKQLNELPPCSRKRAGIVHIMQQINKAELEQAKRRQERLFDAMRCEIDRLVDMDCLVDICPAESAIDDEIARDPGFAVHGGLV